MTTDFSGKRILLGVTGGIAAYKAIDWLRNLQKDGAEMTVVMTDSAARFVPPLTFEALTGKRVYQNMFAHDTGADIPHISLARDHDLVLVAPATARTIGRLANGICDDLLSTVILATTARVVICPSMNSNMYSHPAVQANLARLRDFGYVVVEPESGALACGEVGPGRLPDWDMVREIMLKEFSTQDLDGHTVLVTAGPTREALDPVRFLSNRSSGRMGFALARTAARRGADVILVSGPTSLAEPPWMQVVQVTTAAEMHAVVLKFSDIASVIVKAAAVKPSIEPKPDKPKAPPRNKDAELAKLAKWQKEQEGG